jgi:hypothetical protein
MRFMETLRLAAAVPGPANPEPFPSIYEQKVGKKQRSRNFLGGAALSSEEDGRATGVDPRLTFIIRTQSPATTRSIKNLP